VSTALKTCVVKLRLDLLLIFDWACPGLTAWTALTTAAHTLGFHPFPLWCVSFIAVSLCNIARTSALFEEALRVPVLAIAEGGGGSRMPAKTERKA
jgi:hypothetical protein